MWIDGFGKLSEVKEARHSESVGDCRNPLAAASQASAASQFRVVDSNGPTWMGGPIIHVYYSPNLSISLFVSHSSLILDYLLL